MRPKNADARLAVFASVLQDASSPASKRIPFARKTHTPYNASIDARQVIELPV